MKPLSHYRALVLEQRKQQVVDELTDEQRKRGVEVVAGEVNPIPEIVTLLQLLERFGDGFAHLSSQIIEPSRNSEIDFDAATVHHINKGIANLNTLMHDLLDEMIFHERELDEEAEELQRQVEGKEAA